MAGVFAAGDVARGPTSAGGPREIHALWPTAVEQGRVAGANLAGAGVSYAGSLSMNVTEMFGLTVASLGRFVEGEGDDVVESRDLAGIRYLKLVSRAGVPVGAISLGEPEGAALLGRLRPFVRVRSGRCRICAAFLDGDDLRRSRLVGAQDAPKERDAMRIVAVDPDSCVACRNCEYACAFRQSGDFDRRASHIRVNFYAEERACVPLTCMHCDEAWCLEVCPAAAISRDPDTGAVAIDASAAPGARCACSPAPTATSTSTRRRA